MAPVWPKRVERSEAEPARPAKPSRRTVEGNTRLFMSVGSESGLTSDDLIKVIQGETGLPAQTVAAVDMREAHSFIDVKATEASGIIAKLNRVQLKGKRLNVKAA